MKKVFKFIFSLALVLMACLVFYIGYLYIQNPLVVSRLGGVIMGKNPGIPEKIISGKGIPIGTILEESLISQNALSKSINFAKENDSHALLVFHQDNLQLEHYFEGYSKNHTSSTASMHKTVLAILIGIAIDQGYIKDVDVFASTYITEWANDDRKNITIRQMLQQVSGINFPTFSFHPLSDWNQLVVGDQITQSTISQMSVQLPDQEFAYNGVNPQNLGLLLERSTGFRYSKYLSENLWEKIAEDDAFIFLDSEVTKMPRIFCCLDATARDWLRVGLLILNKGTVNNQQIVSNKWIDQMTTPSTLNPNYGYLTWLGTDHKERRVYNRKSSATAFHKEPFIDNDVIYLDGFGGQRVYIVPSKKLVIVRTGAIQMEWDDSFLVNTISEGINQNNP